MLADELFVFERNVQTWVGNRGTRDPVWNFGPSPAEQTEMQELGSFGPEMRKNALFFYSMSKL